MAESDRDYQIKVLQEQNKALLIALNEVRAKIGLAAVQLPQAAK